MPRNNFILFTIIFLLIFQNNGLALVPTNQKSSLILDVNNGEILHAVKAGELRYPASLVKMMTIYLTFEQLKSGKLSLHQSLYVSKRAASMPRTNLALKAGSSISVKAAVLGLIVHSSNDAAVVLAENIAKNEDNFAVLMNIKAKKLGMNSTRFYNSSGLPHKNQYSTAYDLAKLAIALKRDFPHFFHWFSITSFTFKGKKYQSHNHVVRNYRWATGLKTGFTNASGFNVVTTAKKNGRDLVGIVIGETSAKSRDNFMVNLLNNSFHKISGKGILQAKN